ncbi:hypothetical protein HG531_006577 [Fusarium graminearum]|nr:hypothetical protein HG531_006577 [Fusarium graminearum]
MSSQKIQDFIDDSSFNPPPSRAANDPTGVPIFPPEESCGRDFQPFHLQHRDFKIKALPQEPLELFQLFLPISLIQSWIEYTNSWVAHLIENAVIDNWNTPLTEHSHILKWEGLSTSTAYIWLAIMIYLGIHREKTIRDHWKSPSIGDQRPLHSIIKFMPLKKFKLITRYFHTFDHTKLDVTNEKDLPKTFQAAKEWSDHIQKVSLALYLPGTNLTVDKCIIPFIGRSKETTVIKNKPTPVGFKVWAVAQQGYFLQWLWHVKASPYKAVIVELPSAKPYGKKGKLQTEISLNNNLFSSPHLFRHLRTLGIGATGTARPNCGITTTMKQIKETGKAPDGSTLKYNKVVFIPTEDNKVIQIAWKDSTIVLFLSTVHSRASHERTPKKRKMPAKRGTKAEQYRLQEYFNGESFKIISIPTIAAQYNNEMNHVDRGDQIRSYTTYEHCFRRGPWQALLWSFLLEVALANSFILQRETTQPHWKPYITLKD